LLEQLYISKNSKSIKKEILLFVYIFLSRDLSRLNFSPFIVENSKGENYMCIYIHTQKNTHIHTYVCVCIFIYDLKFKNDKKNIITQYCFEYRCSLDFGN